MLFLKNLQWREKKEEPKIPQGISSHFKHSPKKKKKKKESRIEKSRGQRYQRRDTEDLEKFGWSRAAVGRVKCTQIGADLECLIRPMLTNSLKRRVWENRQTKEREGRGAEIEKRKKWTARALAKIASRGGEWLGSFSILAGRMVCASLCLSGDQRRVRERKKLRMVKREILRDIESDDKEETQRKRERERERERE